MSPITLIEARDAFEHDLVEDPLPVAQNTIETKDLSMLWHSGMASRAGRMPVCR